MNVQDKNIKIKGAREHNLKNIDLEIPRGRMVVITGVSGSGKSSIAFDTLYAEGQRRYVESLSAYARQFIDQMQKPDVDVIEGLSPAISIEQKVRSRNPRSTVATVTEIYDYLRVLFARIGVAYSPATGMPIESETVSQITDRILAIKKEHENDERKVMIVAPVIRSRKGEHKADIVKWGKRGFTRIIVDGEVYSIDNAPNIDKNKRHSIGIVVDRLRLDDSKRSRLSSAVESAEGLSEGLVELHFIDQKKDPIIFSTKYACPVSGFTIEEIEPRIFSFNSPHGACKECGGLGVSENFDLELVIPNVDARLNADAVAPWARSGSHASYYQQILNNVAAFEGYDVKKKFSQLSQKQQHRLLHGIPDVKIPFVFEDEEAGKKYQTKRTFEGVLGNLKRRYKETTSNLVRDEMQKFISKTSCDTCNGYRLCPESLAVKIVGKHIGELCEMSVVHSMEWFQTVENKLSEKHKTIASRLLMEIRERINFLINVGLGYLTLSRGAATLSGGESQRIRLASQIGSRLSGVIYVLDEPSIGLHQRDNLKLITALKSLRDIGNTVVVVEHDEETMLQSDYLVDVGPYAGRLGGKIVAKGTPAEVMKDSNSITAKYLSGELSVYKPRRSIRSPKSGYSVKLKGASAHNLKSVNVDIPLGLMVVVSGVSGSGKSSLIIETLYKILAKSINGASVIPGKYDSIEGIYNVDSVIQIDQSPIGRTPRSNPATYTGLFTPMREWFASLPEAKARGYTASRFSFNVRGGRCEACSGDGVLKIEMHFLPDVYVDCDICAGKRYNRETLDIKFKGKNIAHFLEMSVDEAFEYFNKIPQINEKLRLLQKVGLGYICLGQSAKTLSGGEAQRIKLARELSKRSTGRSFYLLDEPTTGLHAHDISNLLQVLQGLVEKGNTVLVIEHNISVISSADWVIDVGPEGGDKGGEIVAVGVPSDIAKNPNSYTGKFLAKELKLAETRAAKNKKTKTSKKKTAA